MNEAQDPGRQSPAGVLTTGQWQRLHPLSALFVAAQLLRHVALPVLAAVVFGRGSGWEVWAAVPLGVTAIWLNPIYDNNNQLDQKEVFDGEATTGYHGYGAVDFYAVEEHFGDIKKFRELVEAAHKLGIKIIQDQVANHTGPYHPWVKDAPTPTWFNGTAENHINENWQTHLLIDRYATAEMLKPVLEHPLNLVISKKIQTEQI